MKTIFKSCILFLSYAFLFVTCQNDMDFTNTNIIDEAITDSKDIIVADGFIKNPKWLAHIVDSIGRHYQPTPGTGQLLYPFVFAVQHKNQEYICVCDAFSSACNNHYYTLLGNLVDPHSGYWFDLDEEKERTLLWSPPWSSPNERVNTRAWVGTVNVTTPIGNPVSDTWERSEEISVLDIPTILADLKIQYPNATIVNNSSPTTTYNCHAYAWHMTAPQNGSAVWMGRYSNPTSAYWQDDSYISATISNGANKVAYLSDNHSAVVVSTDYFTSKWGRWPLMSHNKNYSPYNASLLGYYKRYNPPAYYISQSFDDWSGGSTVYASSGYASVRRYAFKHPTATTPNSFVWSIVSAAPCDRWYLYPNGSYADFNVYFTGQSGGIFRIECKMYNGSTLLGTATYYQTIYP